MSRGDSGVRSATIAATQLRPPAVYEALGTLAAWNLVSPTGDGR